MLARQLIAIVLTSCTSAMLVVPAWATQTRASAPPVPEPAAFRHAWAASTCAPWDGSAWQVMLQTSPIGKADAGQLPPAAYPCYRVLVWTGHPPLGTWLDLPGKLNGNESGRITYIPAQGQYVEVQGQVRFTSMAQERLVGELRLGTGSWWPGGRTIPFNASVIQQRVFCGARPGSAS